MVSVGLIVNPAASRDVRRLTSLARTVDVHERVNVVARILRGLTAAGVDSISYMAEPCHVVERSVEELLSAGVMAAARLPGWQPVNRADGGDAEDAPATSRAAAAMAEAGVACIVTVGGDGTNRAVALGSPDAVLLPLPGGTNNAFARAVDPTAAGLAAGLYARDPAGLTRHVTRSTKLEVAIGGRPCSMALVDVALVAGGWVGAHAIWEPDLLEEAVVARSDPTLTGLAGVGGMVCPLDGGEPRALHLRFGSPGRRIAAPLGPGQLVPMSVRDWRTLGPGEPAALRDESPSGLNAGPAGLGPEPSLPAEVPPAAFRPAEFPPEAFRPAEFRPATLAFDGEREIVLRPGDRVEVRLSEHGPRVLDPAGLLRNEAGAGLAVNESGGIRRRPPEEAR